MNIKSSISFKDGLILTVIILVMLNNIEHLAWVHYTLSAKALPQLPFDWLNKLHSVLAVIIFELVIITMAIRGRHTYAGWLSFAIWILSMIYYDVPGMLSANGSVLQVVSPDQPAISPSQVASPDQPARYASALAATIYSTVFTLSIYMFSRMIADRIETQATDQQLRSRIYQLQSELNEAQSALVQSESLVNEHHTALEGTLKIMNDREKELHQLKKWKADYDESRRCPYCHQLQSTPDSLRAHKGHCSAKGKPARQTELVEVTSKPQLGKSLNQLLDE